MRIFVAGATGVLGRRAVASLIAAGHDVTGIARTPAKAAELRAQGASPVEVSLFDPDALRAAVGGHDAVVNLATKIPSLSRAARDSAWAENTRIRVEGSRNLVDAAIAAGAQVFVQESIAFQYGEHGTEWIDADQTPVSDSPFLEPNRTAEVNAARFGESGGRAVVLRFGAFQAADAAHTIAAFDAARRGMLLDLVAPDGYQPAIDADDAATAVVAALAAPSGTYDIVDEPITRREYSHALARAVGRRRLTSMRPMARAGGSKANVLAWSQRVSNAKFVAATGWRPESATLRDTVRKVAAEMHVEPALSGVARALLWLLALFGLSLGVYAQFFPRAFYDDFPFGRSWVAHDGPYNEHLIRDFGAMNLALTAVTLAALYFGSLAAARAAAAGWIVFSVPHFLYHLRNLEHYDTVDQFGNVVSLASALLLAVLLGIVLARPRRRLAPPTAARTDVNIPA
jgi:nucleoside-diphosphate-sugar epimerase